MLSRSASSFYKSHPTSKRIPVNGRQRNQIYQWIFYAISIEIRYELPMFWERPWTIAEHYSLRLRTYFFLPYNNCNSTKFTLINFMYSVFPIASLRWPLVCIYDVELYWVAFYILSSRYRSPYIAGDHTVRGLRMVAIFFYRTCVIHHNPVKFSTRKIYLNCTFTRTKL